MKKGITTLMVVVFMMAEYAPAQTSWSDHENRTTVSLVWDSPHFGTDFMGGIRTNLMTSVGYLNARVRLNDNVFILAEVPVSHFEWRLEGAESRLFNKNTEWGSPFIGTEFRVNEGAEIWQPFFNIGTYLPKKQKTMYMDELLLCNCVIQEYGELATTALYHNIKLGAHPALLSDFDRGEAFWPDVWSVRANAGTSRLFNENNTLVRFSTGMIHNIYRGEWAELMNRETYLTYSAYVSSKLDGFIVHSVLFGRSPLGVSDLNFKEDTIMQFRVGLTRDLGIVNLGGYFRVPMTKSYLNNVKFSYGLNLAINL
jgi:hypothetical protein